MQNNNTSPYLAFNKEWFEKNQTILLKLLNWKLTKKLFRWILCIRKCDVGYDATIVKIEPNSYTVVKRFSGENVELITDFRTHPKFSKRLYHAFKPIWWAMHYWDEVFADRYAPQLSFGFDTLTAYPDANPETSTVDGRVTRTLVDENWATIIAGAGNDFVDDLGTVTILEATCSGTTNQFSVLSRSIFLFDTSALTAGATISAAVLSLYGAGKSDTMSATPDIDIYTSTPASNTSLANSDYGQIGSTSQTGSPITYANFNTADYNDFTFNATGRGNISKTGISKFGVRNANHDVAASAPTWSSGTQYYLTAHNAERGGAGTTQDPKLVVTYTVASTQVFSPSGGASYGGVFMY